MEPNIKKGSPLRGKNRPGLEHGVERPKIEQRQRNEVAATRRALRKAARREGRKAIEFAVDDQ